MKDRKRDVVLVYGSGTMGCGIACCAALAGESVILLDIDAATAQKGIGRVRGILEDMQAHGLYKEADVLKAVERVNTAEDLESVKNTI